MNEEKLKQILNKIGQTDIPPNAALIAEQTSRNFSTDLVILRQQHWFLTPVRLLAAAALVIFAFVIGRFSKPLPITSPNTIASVSVTPAYPTDQKNEAGFWQQTFQKVRSTPMTPV